MSQQAEIQSLIAVLSHSASRTRFQAARGLVKFGAAAVPNLCEVLRYSWREHERAAAAYALGEIGASGGVLDLIRALELEASDTPSLVSTHAYQALQKIDTPLAQIAVARWEQQRKPVS